MRSKRLHDANDRHVLVYDTGDEVVEQLLALAQREQLAVDVTLNGSESQIHARAVVGKADATAWAGHLPEGEVWPALELVPVESPAERRRALDEETQLPLISIETEEDQTP